MKIKLKLYIDYERILTKRCDMKKNKILKRILLGMVTTVLIYVSVVIGLMVHAQMQIPPNGVDTLIVLGAQVKGENPAIPSLRLQERLEGAYSYWQENPKVHIIVTGGQGEDESEPEGEVMGEYLLRKGVPAAQLTIENTSTTTLENIENAQKLYPFDRVVIMTNDFHAYRAGYIAKKYGIKEVYTRGVPMQGGINIKGYFREIFAITYHYFITN